MSDSTKAVLISIRAEWAQKIFCGKKLLEIRKSIPRNLKPPFLCYVYISGKDAFDIIDSVGDIQNGCRKVVGTFLCDKIEHYVKVGFRGGPLPAQYKLCDGRYAYGEIADSFYASSCMTKTQLEAYTGGNEFYAWHIRDVRRLCFPLEVTDFYQIPLCETVRKFITRPPQSWCYVEGFD